MASVECGANYPIIFFLLLACQNTSSSIIIIISALIKVSPPSSHNLQKCILWLCQELKESQSLSFSLSSSLFSLGSKHISSDWKNFVLLSESEEPDHDDKPVGGAILARLQAAVGPGGVRRCVCYILIYLFIFYLFCRGEDVARAQRPHLETWHRSL